uniref:Neuronal-specific septin-3 n=2 Tax=Knipowitschia caucasica TaxID=637954 RepID=A0AAV2LK47_KNICA
MSDPLTSLIPKVSERSRRPKTLLLPPALPCPPVIKKTPIQISSFDERGLVCAIGPNSERSFVPILEKKCGQEASRQKSHEEKASTMKRMMSKMHYPAKLKSSTSPTSELETCHSLFLKDCHLVSVPAYTGEEDPYVTMYCLGSVYEDMSDIVPPEVKPKPAIPAKPPNVGAASPSSPFSPPMPPSAPSTGASLPPPSAIPVLIGSHGPSHSSSHSVTHSGHSAGHGVTHPPAPSGGHTTHSSSGGSTLLGYIGIDTIIEQMRRKTMKTGFDFNIMVVGNSGLGKSTLLNTLFKSQVSRKSAGWSRDEKIPKTVEMKSVSHVIEEGGVKMKLTVVDTPGFGDQINNDNCWDPISKYINEQFEKFLKEEVNITRKKRIPDTRVHCCIYFISPTGHSLRQLDLEFMKRLSHSVNIIPVIAKADTMTIEERQEFKQRVRKELEMGGIEFYPQKEFDDDMEDKSDNDKIRETMPFAVVGSEKEYQVNSKRVLGRKTAWGIVEVENPNHCEFAQLRDFLIRSHLQDLKEVTHNIHYETYRAKRLNENGGLHPISDTQDSNL